MEISHSVSHSVVNYLEYIVHKIDKKRIIIGENIYSKYYIEETLICQFNHLEKTAAVNSSILRELRKYCNSNSNIGYFIEKTICVWLNYNDFKAYMERCDTVYFFCVYDPSGLKLAQLKK